MTKKMMITGLVAVFAAMTASAALITVDNYVDEQNGATGGAVGNYIVQSFTPNVAGLGSNDTVTANSPLPATVYLQTATFLRADSGSGTAGDLYINVYEGAAGNTGTFLGSSSNAIDVNNTAAVGTMLWNFGNIALDSTAQIALVFSTTTTDDSAVSARLQVARTAAGAFANTYDGGASSNNADGSGATSYETRFAVGIDTIPEPATIGLLGLGTLVAFIARRMKA